ncbi:hypothetical protein BDR26DRAFT_857488 [Obelidium mucronatum]|nr:hypothetical protein BDR26DRAFT_857488 [Obelidium mucronatum]
MSDLLGRALVEEVQELQSEAQVLMDIRSEYRYETQELMGCHEKSSFDSLVSRPSFQYNALKQRIYLLLENPILKGNELVPDADSRLLNYVRITSESQMPTIINQSGTTTRNQNLLIQILDNFGIFSNGGVDPGRWQSIIQELRKAIIEERDWLLQEINRLHNILDEERMLRSSAEKTGPTSAPTINELQKLKDDLESKCMKSEPLATHQSSLHYTAHQNTAYMDYCSKDSIQVEIDELMHEMCLLDLEPNQHPTQNKINTESFKTETQNFPESPPPDLKITPDNAVRTPFNGGTHLPPSSSRQRKLVPINSIELSGSTKRVGNSVTPKPPTTTPPAKSPTHRGRNGVLLQPLVSTIGSKPTYPPSLPLKPKRRESGAPSRESMSSGSSSLSLENPRSLKFNRKLRISSTSSIDSSITCVEPVSPL